MNVVLSDSSFPWLYNLPKFLQTQLTLNIFSACLASTIPFRQMKDHPDEVLKFSPRP